MIQDLSGSCVSKEPVNQCSSVPLMHHDPDRSWITDPYRDHPKGTHHLLIFLMLFFQLPYFCIGLLVSRTFDGTQNSPYELKKLSVLSVSSVLFSPYKTAVLGKTLGKLSLHKILVTSKKLVSSSSHVFVPYLVLLANITLTRVGLVKILAHLFLIQDP